MSDQILKRKRSDDEHIIAGSAITSQKRLRQGHELGTAKVEGIPVQSGETTRQATSSIQSEIEDKENSSRRSIQTAGKSSKEDDGIGEDDEDDDNEDEDGDDEHKDEHKDEDDEKDDETAEGDEDNDEDEDEDNNVTDEDHEVDDERQDEDEDEDEDEDNETEEADEVDDDASVKDSEENATESGNSEESDSNADESDDSLSAFREVLSSIRIKNLPDLASKLRQQIDKTSDLINCVVLEEPLHGSYNIIFIIEFTDGIKWLLKVSASATFEYFDETLAQRMKSEVETTRFIKKKTTIPLPTIYGYDISFSNAINSPYIMMEMLEGQELEYQWFDESISQEDLEKRRKRTLRDLAAYMNQLGNFRYDLGGPLIFDDDGEPCGIGPIASFDEVGPFSKPAAFHTRNLDLETQDDLPSKAIARLIRLFVDWLPQGSDAKKFVLKHPDLDVQNILVAPDGSVTGIIDWDKVRAEPRCIGNEAYPLWLLTDWDAGNLIRMSDRMQNTPQEIARYRTMYQGFMAENSSDAETVEMTKISSIAASIACAARGGHDGHEMANLKQIMHRIVEATADDPRIPQEARDITVPLAKVLNGTEEDPHAVASNLTIELAKRIELGTVSKDEMDWLRDGFRTLCSKL